MNSADDTKLPFDLKFSTSNHKPTLSHTPLVTPF